MLEHGLEEAGTCTCFQLDLYMRPTLATSVCRRNLLPPAPSAGRSHAYASKWGVVVAPSESGETTKTGQQDNSLVLADVAHAYLCDAAVILYSRVAAPESRFSPGLKQATCAAAFRKATNARFALMMFRALAPRVIAP